MCHLLLSPASNELHWEGATHERLTLSPTVPLPTVQAPVPSAATRTPTCKRFRLNTLEPGGTASRNDVI